ncbi:MAG: hypothetical protein KJO43_05255, partial [Phycisphaerae bacterium]|nr:hypothetical protein [Phycisphaerae bacterium]
MTGLSSISCVIVVAMTMAAAGPPAGPGAPVPVPAPATIDQLDPPRRLGARSVAALHTREIIPDVVIVPDAASYLGAIEAWTSDRFWPVLIDDGSLEARDDIARFVRGFAPRRVVRWSGRDRVWPETPAGRVVAVERALARAW